MKSDRDAEFRIKDLVLDSSVTIFLFQEKRKMSKNEITGKEIITTPTTASYANGWDLIWGKKKQLQIDIEESKEREDEDLPRMVE